MKKKNISESLITELAFKLIYDSEETEGYRFNVNTITPSSSTHLKNIDKQTILTFLKDESTKVSVKIDNELGRNFLIASNSVRHESITISGLADHYLTLLDIVEKATRNQKEYAKNNKALLLSHELVKETNLSLQSHRYGEVGIGRYRYLDLNRNPVKMCVTTTIDGEKRNVLSIPFSKYSEVAKDMENLINWVNGTTFKEDRDIIMNIAEFNARFIKIHPFVDGNGRTGRLLMNYILLSLNQPPISIPAERKQDYIQSLNYANTSSVRESTEDIAGFKEFLTDKYIELTGNAESSLEEVICYMEKYRTEENKYDFLYQLFKNCQLNLSSESVVSSILNNYGKRTLDSHERIGKITSEQIDYLDIDYNNDDNENE